MQRTGIWSLAAYSLLCLFGAAAGWAQTGPSISQLQQPESIVYVLLRQASAGTARDETALSHFRALAHDRKRQVRGEWLSPGDFARRRGVFQELLKEAQGEFRQVSSKPQMTQREQLERSRHLAAGQDKLRRAAQAWVDPLLQAFLLGVADMDAGDSVGALAHFDRCAELQPKAAAFPQGRAIALLQRQRYTDAIRAALAVLDLRPDSREAVSLAKKTMKSVPGTYLNTPIFREAKERLSGYASDHATPASPGSKSNTTTWLLPGKPVRAKEHSLPEPPKDRLIVRQAVGAPVRTDTLLVDARALDGADDILVRIDEGRYAPGRLRRLTAPRGAAIPLAAVQVTGYAFTPLELSDDASAGADRTAYTIDLLEEMGGSVRSQPMSPGGEAKPLLAPGETAAPVLDARGRLAGFLVRDLDCLADSLPEEFLPAERIAPLLKHLPKTASRYGFGGARRTVTTQPARGGTFVVYAICGERFDDK